MASDWVSDKHTLFIKCGCATSQQIRECILSGITRWQRATKSTNDLRIRVNLVENREGISQGIAYVYIFDTEIYHMILGDNPDGTERIKYIEDPSWKAPISSSNEWAAIAPPVLLDGKSWGDFMDEEEDYEKAVQEHENMHKAPLIPISLPPLITIPSIMIDDNQSLSLAIDAAKSPPIDPKLMHNVLKSRDVPDWVTTEDIKRQFSTYAHGSVVTQALAAKGIEKNRYPIVNINDKRVAFVTFDPQTNDAIFALFMLKKLNVNRVKRDGGVETATLIFSYSIRSNKDEQRTQKPKETERRRYDNRRDGFTPARTARKDKQPIKPQSKGEPRLSNKFAFLDDNM